MISGRLKHAITIEQPTGDRSTSGQPTIVWSTFADVYADIYSVTGKEWFEAHQVNSSVTTKIVIRYLDGVRPDMRVKHGETVYNIIAVLNQENPRKPTTLMCEREQ
ncbi:MAG: phage head closure protein [Candidatus Thiodiazotropha endolucinida]